jgi:acylphosphatase
MTTGHAGPDDRARLEASVRGRVHGVGFRYYVVSRASALGLTGWVSNEQDGSVRCVAEGPRADLLALLELLHEGPASSIVERVIEDWLPYTGAWGSFGIRSSGHSGD